MSDLRDRQLRRNANGLVVHVVVPGWTAGAKSRSVPDSSALCGASVWENQAGSVVDVIPPLHAPARWCPKCLGLEAARLGVTPALIRLLHLDEVQP